MMTLLYSDAVFLEHQTGSHPESAERIRSIRNYLKKEGLDQQCTCPDIPVVTASRLARVHPPEYTDMIQQFAAQGGGRIESDTMVSRASYDVALRAAGAAADAVAKVMRGDHRRALCVVRPPGHHALPSKVMGFCLFNNVAIAARVATSEFDADRVLIVDWDVHHGNGTQAMFWEEERVGFFSIHRWPFYPGTGAANETGEGRGLGTVMNLPIEFGISRNDYCNSFADNLQHFAGKIRPQLVLISAGFDSHRLDPIGSLGLETEDFEILTRSIVEIAATHAEGRVVSILEGGYNTEVLGECLGRHLKELMT